MPQRRETFLDNHYYHVFNKTIDRKRVFDSTTNCKRFLDTVRYYRSTNATVGFARLVTLDKFQREHIEKIIQEKGSFIVQILSYCLMPNHYHFLLKQTKENGVQKLISNITNSLTRYLNIKSERRGPYFLPRFHAVTIRGHEQLIHTSRYIHLNPLLSKLVESDEALLKYKWSSYPDYVTDSHRSLTTTNFILRLFDNNKGRYKKFVEGNSDYRQTLEYEKRMERG